MKEGKREESERVKNGRWKLKERDPVYLLKSGASVLLKHFFFLRLSFHPFVDALLLLLYVVMELFHSDCLSVVQ